MGTDLSRDRDEGRHDVGPDVTITLHLGVISVPYAHAPAAPTKVAQARAGKANAPKATTSAGATVTTDEVARWLEAKYHVMEHFVELHQNDIADALAETMLSAIENVQLGAPIDGSNALASAFGAIENDFKKMLTSKELDSLGYPGIPTKAALDGVSHRFKSKRGPKGRPSFVDSGLYEASFKVWTEG